jgi:uncharacterized protein (TIGR03067 family)
MSRTTTFALALLVTASLGFAPAPVYRPRRGGPEEELKNLQGTWILVSRTRAGRTPSHGLFAVDVRDNRWTFSSKDGTWHTSWFLSLDVKKSPKQIDLRGDGWEGSACAIYENKGDTLEFAFELDTSLRPTNFRGDSSKWYVDVYRRQKP